MASLPESDRGAPLSERSYIPCLDGFRALAVFLVMFWHYHVSLYLPGPFGVTTFFFISGFLITSLLLQEQARGGIAVGRFWLRRLLRLWPALLVVVLVSQALMQWQGEPAKPLEMLSAAFYFTNYYRSYMDGPHADMFGPLWSLAVEEHFYLIFPLLLMLCGSSRRRMLWLSVTLISVPLLLRLYYFYELQLGAITYSLTETRFDNIAWGCLLAVLSESSRRAIFRRLRWWVLIVSGLVLVYTFYNYEPEFAQVWKHSFQSAALFLLFGSFFYSSKFTWTYALLESRPMRKLGQISYEIYLWHMPVHFTVLTWFQGYTAAFISLTITLSLSWLLHQAVGVPIKSLRKRLHPKAAPAP